MSRSARETVQSWVDAFNKRDAEAVAAHYHDDAVNHQVVQDPIEGRAAIGAMFAREFSTADMTCIIDNLFATKDNMGNDWAILEWRDPNGLRGCGFFLVRDGKIAFQRGYFDRLRFLKLHGLPVPDDA